MIVLRLAADQTTDTIFAITAIRKSSFISGKCINNAYGKGLKKNISYCSFQTGKEKIKIMLKKFKVYFQTDAYVLLWTGIKG